MGEGRSEKEMREKFKRKIRRERPNETFEEKVRRKCWKETFEMNVPNTVRKFRILFAKFL